MGIENRAMLRLSLLIAVTVIFPFAWGWATHWFVTKLWPLKTPIPTRDRHHDSLTTLHDYQI